jgi:hypoxanthine phosphoribosyltransferase
MEKLNDRIDEFDVILGIKNGGINVSKPIASFFNKPHLDIHISFYDGEQKLIEPQLKEINNCIIEKLKDNKFLLVDDIVDSGSTLKWFIDNTGLKKGVDFSVASIHWCEENSPDLMPEFFVSKKSKFDWIYFPWEK